MEIVKKKNSTKLGHDRTCIVWEYPTENRVIGGAMTKITGRYPAKGFSLNVESNELVFVLSGKGKLSNGHKTLNLASGDLVVINAKEKYYFQGNFKLFLANSPTWDPKQYKVVS